MFMQYFAFAETIFPPALRENSPWCEGLDVGSSFAFLYFKIQIRSVARCRNTGSLAGRRTFYRFRCVPGLPEHPSLR